MTLLLGDSRIRYAVTPWKPQQPVLTGMLKSTIKALTSNNIGALPLAPQDGKTPESDREPLNNYLQQVFSFSTRIVTDLNILFVGDSVALQMAMGASTVTHSFLSSRIDVLERLQGGQVGMLAAAPVQQGGGSIGFWRLTGLFLKEHENSPLPHKGELPCRAHTHWLNDFSIHRSLLTTHPPSEN